MVSLNPTQSGLGCGEWTDGYDCQNKERKAHDCCKIYESAILLVHCIIENSGDSPQ